MEKTVYDEFRAGRILITLSEIERFFQSVDKTGECWNWTGYLDKRGYARVGIHGVQQLGHVVSYVLHNGSIPEGLHVCHSCDNPKCVNPAHLWVGTHQENMKDRDSKGRGVVVTRTGSGCNFAKLTDLEVLEIRRCVSAGAKQVEMVKRFGVKAPAINSIIKQKTWKHLI